MIFPQEETHPIEPVLDKSNETVDFSQHLDQQATSCPSLQCLIDQTQVQKPIQVAAMYQKPDHT